MLISSSEASFPKIMRWCWKPPWSQASTVSPFPVPTGGISSQKAIVSVRPSWISWTFDHSLVPSCPITCLEWPQEAGPPAPPQDLRQGWLYPLLHLKDRHNTGPVPKAFWATVVIPSWICPSLSAPQGESHPAVWICTSNLPEQSVMLAVHLHPKLLGHTLSSGGEKSTHQGFLISHATWFFSPTFRPTVLTMGCLIWKHHTWCCLMNLMDPQGWEGSPGTWGS